MCFLLFPLLLPLLLLIITRQLSRRTSALLRLIIVLQGISPVNLLDELCTWVLVISVEFGRHDWSPCQL